MDTRGIPPNGFLGLGNQSLAVQTMTSKAMGGNRRSARTNGARKRRKKSNGSATARKPRKLARAAGRLKKGSAAAKAWGAKMRRLRRKK